MCNNVLAVRFPDSKVVSASGIKGLHRGTQHGSLDLQSYDGKLPSDIYEQYMMTWKDVN